MLLPVADRVASCAIALRVGMRQDTARKSRHQYCEQGIDGRADAPGSGRPWVPSAVVAARVRALACEMPAVTGAPPTRWSCPELARRVVAERMASTPSPPRCAAGPPMRRSSSGSTDRGSFRATRAWRSKQGPQPLLAAMARSSARRRRLRPECRRKTRRPGTLAHPPAACARTGRRCASRVSTTTTALSRTRQHATSTVVACSAVASRPPGSSRSPHWWTSSCARSRTRRQNVFWTADNGASRRN